MGEYSLITIHVMRFIIKEFLHDLLVKMMCNLSINAYNQMGYDCFTILISSILLALCSSPARAFLSFLRILGHRQNCKKMALHRRDTVFSCYLNLAFEIFGSISGKKSTFYRICAR
jgi:hypothetical protein